MAPPERRTSALAAEATRPVSSVARRRRLHPAPRRDRRAARVQAPGRPRSPPPAPVGDVGARPWIARAAQAAPRADRIALTRAGERPARRSPSSTARARVRPELWRLGGAPSGRARPYGPYPPSPPRSVRARRIWPAGTGDLERLADVGPGGLAVLPLPAGGRPARRLSDRLGHPARLRLTNAPCSPPPAGLAGRAPDARPRLRRGARTRRRRQRQLLPRRLPKLPGACPDNPLPAQHRRTGAGRRLVRRDPAARPPRRLIIGDVQGHSAGAATPHGPNAHGPARRRRGPSRRTCGRLPRQPDAADMERLYLPPPASTPDLDMEEGSAWCVRAGHLPPVLRHSDGHDSGDRGGGGAAPPLSVVVRCRLPG
ncbi:hypothetical protein LV779_21215 [Streptomyces thinghirensis]|nr:hypothetical protein [Streptomyces thinghirensis]